MSPKYFFYGITWSPNCPSSCNDPHKLMWEKTLSQVLELQEACEMRDCIDEARALDERAAAKAANQQ